MTRGQFRCSLLAGACKYISSAVHACLFLPGEMWYWQLQKLRRRLLQYRISQILSIWNRAELSVSGTGHDHVFPCEEKLALSPFWLLSMSSATMASNLWWGGIDFNYLQPERESFVNGCILFQSVCSYCLGSSCSL